MEDHIENADVSNTNLVIPDNINSSSNLTLTDSNNAQGQGRQQTGTQEAAQDTNNNLEQASLEIIVPPAIGPEAAQVIDPPQLPIGGHPATSLLEDPAIKRADQLEESKLNQHVIAPIVVPKPGRFKKQKGTGNLLQSIKSFNNNKGQFQFSKNQSGTKKGDIKQHQSSYLVSKVNVQQHVQQKTLKRKGTTNTIIVENAKKPTSVTPPPPKRQKLKSATLEEPPTLSDIPSLGKEGESHQVSLPQLNKEATPQPQFNDEVEVPTSCPSCTMTYDCDKKVPLFLPSCEHCICNECWQSIEQDSCISCQLPFPTEYKDLLVNWHILRAVKKVDNEELGGYPVPRVKGQSYLPFDKDSFKVKFRGLRQAERHTQLIVIYRQIVLQDGTLIFDHLKLSHNRAYQICWEDFYTFWYFALEEDQKSTTPTLTQYEKAILDEQQLNQIQLLLPELYHITFNQPELRMKPCYSLKQPAELKLHQASSEAQNQIIDADKQLNQDKLNLLHALMTKQILMAKYDVMVARPPENGEYRILGFRFQQPSKTKSSVVLSTQIKQRQFYYLMLQKLSHEGSLRFHSPIELKCSILMNSLTFFSERTQLMISNYYRQYFTTFMNLTYHIKFEHLQKLRELKQSKLMVQQFQDYYVQHPEVFQQPALQNQIQGQQVQLQQNEVFNNVQTQLLQPTIASNTGNADDSDSEYTLPKSKRRGRGKKIIEEVKEPNSNQSSKKRSATEKVLTKPQNCENLEAGNGVLRQKLTSKQLQLFFHIIGSTINGKILNRDAAGSHSERFYAMLKSFIAACSKNKAITWYEDLYPTYATVKYEGYPSFNFLVMTSIYRCRQNQMKFDQNVQYLVTNWKECVAYHQVFEMHEKIRYGECIQLKDLYLKIKANPKLMEDLKHRNLQQNAPNSVQEVVVVVPQDQPIIQQQDEHQQKEVIIVPQDQGQVVANQGDQDQLNLNGSSSCEDDKSSSSSDESNKEAAADQKQIQEQPDAVKPPASDVELISNNQGDHLPLAAKVPGDEEPLKPKGADVQEQPGNPQPIQVESKPNKTELEFQKYVDECTTSNITQHLLTVEAFSQWDALKEFESTKLSAHEYGWQMDANNYLTCSKLSELSEQEVLDYFDKARAAGRREPDIMALAVELKKQPQMKH